MIARSAALRIARLAGEVLEKTGTKARMANGYTRVDPIEIAEEYGVDVLVRPLDQLLGIFLREDHPGILLNSLRPAGHRSRRTKRLIARDCSLQLAKAVRMTFT